MKKEAFIYEEAFSRNLGLLDPESQSRIRNVRLGIAGVGGVGGGAAILAARHGIQNFTLADLDTFEIGNFNRQFGASMKTIGVPKISAIKDLLAEINPEVQTSDFSNGLDLNNIRDFVSASDMIFDCLDFYCYEMRSALHAESRRQGKIVFLAVPLAYCSTLHCFSAESMSFHEYFGWEENMDPAEMLLRFLVGIAPSQLHAGQMEINLEHIRKRTGPSLGGTCAISSSLLVLTMTKAVLQPSLIKPVPHFCQFDFSKYRVKTGKLFWGNAGPIQKLKLMIGRHQYKDLMKAIA